jgi:hypothetical protein
MLTVREYARTEGITLQGAYLRLWNGGVKAEKRDGKWLIFPEQKTLENTIESEEVQ